VAGSSLGRLDGGQVGSAAGAADRLRALCSEAFAHHQAQRLPQAIERYVEILSLKPDFPDIYNNLGNALTALGNPEAALAAFKLAIELKPDSHDAYYNCAVTLSAMGRLDEAEAKYRQAVAVNPKFAAAYNNLGLLLKERGRLAGAEWAFRRAIRLAPMQVRYYDNLLAVKPFVAGDAHFTALEALAANPAALPAADQVSLHFALGKAYENIDRPDSAFAHFLSGNRFKRSQIDYDEAATLGFMERMREVMSCEFIETRQGGGHPSPVPVFIIGMPRSGTTLIEQILASHPQVFGAGELHLFNEATGAIRSALPDARPFPEMMSAMSAEHFRTLGALYLDAIARRAPGAMRVTDKMTLNFLLAGLIHLALPDATIIHAVRDAADTCVSNFVTHFTDGHAHSYDLAELGRYYRHYRVLMAHWRDALPEGRIMDVCYEDLVADLEGVARRIIAHCGLAWDARCLDFHRTARPIRTASAVQVRKPIYADSVGRWRKYQAFLGPLFAEVEPFTA